ncbi:hypothetical protein [Segniliparus rugosus]|uniref:hypothetical protein n=1 Tax=Segniliparus rugosus TaxID=286804 RepID=UPI0002E1E13B|nr:hypothetical protein [Segniliparus rugosus]
MEVGRIGDLPAHPLFAHFVVALVPLTAAAALAAALWHDKPKPAATSPGRWLGFGCGGRALRRPCDDVRHGRT